MKKSELRKIIKEEIQKIKLNESLNSSILKYISKLNFANDLISTLYKHNNKKFAWDKISNEDFVKITNPEQARKKYYNDYLLFWICLTEKINTRYKYKDKIQKNTLIGVSDGKQLVMNKPYWNSMGYWPEYNLKNVKAFAEYSDVVYGISYENLNKYSTQDLHNERQRIQRELKAINDPKTIKKQNQDRWKTILAQRWDQPEKIKKTMQDISKKVNKIYEFYFNKVSSSLNSEELFQQMFDTEKFRYYDKKMKIIPQKMQYIFDYYETFLRSVKKYNDAEKREYDSQKEKDSSLEWYEHERRHEVNRLREAITELNAILNSAKI